MTTTSSSSRRSTPASRRALLSAAVALLLLGAVVSAETGHSGRADAVGPPPSIDARPNIVLITTDDQTLSDLRWMAKTRHLLGSTGTTFSSMLSPHPLCCPARAEILTGEYAQSNGVHSNQGPYGGFPNLRDPDNTIGSWLQAGGYHTALVGKFLNGWTPSRGIPEGWDHWQSSVRSEFGYYGYTMDVNGAVRTYDARTGPYSTDLVSAVTGALIDRWAGSGSPFFVWSSYYAPHGLCGEQEGCKHPPTPAHAYAHYPVRDTAPSLRDPAFDEKDRSDKPALIRKQKPVGRAFAQRMFTQRIRALQSVDDAVQHTVQRLDADGVRGNTYLLFTSDNGFLIGEHSYVGKILPYEQSLRVPLLVSGPGIAHGATNDQTVTTVDLASTITDMADVAPGRTQDGASLLPMLQGGAPPTRDTALIQAGGLKAGDHTQPWLYRGVRTRRYTFARWYEHGGHSIFRELYDRRSDPHELRNVAGRRRYADVLASLEHRLDILQRCSGTACNRDFGPLPDVREQRHRAGH